jgi:FkbM family methyltransferase
VFEWKLSKIFAMIYEKVFSRPFFYKLNIALFKISLKGLGITNYDWSGEEKVLNLVKNTNPVVFDVGANVGNYSKMILKKFDHCELYCFEPHPKNFKLLKRNLKNKSLNLFNVALGEDNNKIELYDYNDKNGSTHASNNKEVFTKMYKKKFVKYKVNLIRLDDFIKDNKIKKIDLIKIDVEGNELSVLKGSKRIINNSIANIIQFEFNKMNIYTKTTFKDIYDLLNKNYFLYRILPKGYIKIQKYSELENEIYAYQNFIAISKKYSKKEKVTI